jgi:hypothetical protein
MIKLITLILPALFYIKNAYSFDLQSLIEHNGQYTASQSIFNANSVRKETGIKFFVNIKQLGNDTIWEMRTKDTIHYDTYGNKIATITSNARSGWAMDSIFMIDSCVYDNNKLKEKLKLYYTPDFPTIDQSSTKEVYKYTNNYNSC